MFINICSPIYFIIIIIVFLVFASIAHFLSSFHQASVGSARNVCETDVFHENFWIWTEKSHISAGLLWWVRIHMHLLNVRNPRRIVAGSRKGNGDSLRRDYQRASTARVCDPSHIILQSNLPRFVCREVCFTSSPPLNASMMSLHRQYLLMSARDKEFVGAYTRRLNTDMGVLTLRLKIFTKYVCSHSPGGDFDHTPWKATCEVSAENGRRKSSCINR